MPSDRKAIALRLEEPMREHIAQLAKAERRTLANMVEMLVRLGLDVYGSRQRADGGR